MRILAQQGFGPKDKLERGISEGFIQGAILSPRYCTREKMSEHIEALAPLGGQLLMDPELYASRLISHPSGNLGQLETWGHFTMPRRSSLISGAAIPGWIRPALEVQQQLSLSEWIAPNVYIDQADSIETAIALNVIAQAKEVAHELGDNPVYATLAISRDALINRRAFQDVFDALTALPTPPDGFYVLVGCAKDGNGGDVVRSDLYHPEVIAGWMYMNYALSINGLRVINGYCHLISPLLGICGAAAAANGWHTGLRQFSMGKYVKRPRRGGRPPDLRYVSMPLLSRIKSTDYLDFKALIPEVANDLPLDAVFEASEPSRTEEALQSWEAMTALADAYSTGNIEDDLLRMMRHIDDAMAYWIELLGAGFSQEVEANQDRLSAMRDAIDLFTEWAELA